ncbi:MAG: L-threonine 3-dehydrogenase [Oscillospiraceae bacterium]
MNALVKEAPGEGLALKRVPVPQLGVGEVKIRVLKTAICGTDLHIYNWDEWSQRTIHTPMVIGHEFVGEIVEMDEHARGYKVGDIVSGEGHIVCQTCRNCMAGRRHLCKNTVGVGVNRNGAFAEYIVIPYENVVKVADGIDLEIAACFDPLGNAVHTALKYNLVGEDVLITGAGPIGVMAAAICRHCGAKHVVITDVNDYRLDLAKEISDVYPLNVAKETVEDAMRELGMKEGFDIGLEMSGSEMAFNSMIDNMNSGGKVALLGIHSGKTVINWDKVVFSGLTIQGIYGREMFETWYKMMSMLQTGLDISGVITHRLDYRDYEEGFEAMKSGRAGKVILNWAEL